MDDSSTPARSTFTRADFLFLIIAGCLLLLPWVLPLDVLEYLSLNIVGEPPINGHSWLEGVAELGGEASMRFLATCGGMILILGARLFVRGNPLREGTKLSTPARKVTPGELAVFGGSTGTYFMVNISIGYAWWDPGAMLGMGSLFWPSILSVIFLGLGPTFIRFGFKLPADSFAGSTVSVKQNVPLMGAIAFYYGLLSCLWHCCSLFNETMYFFFFVVKFVQLWGMCRFFFYWGLPLLQQAFHRKAPATVVTAVLFGLCYPWHTLGFAVTFMLFGGLLAITTDRTRSYWLGLLLLYFSYIFHAALPWHGAGVTFSVVYPLGIGVLGLTVFSTTRRCFRQNSPTNLGNTIH